jgi:NTE family protein
MKSVNPQFGLVLTGGGAKGAYQVGALKYLAEIGFKPHIIAGSSIGALNSAILSADRPFPDAVDHLEKLWAKLAKLKPLKINALAILIYAVNFVAPLIARILVKFWKLRLDSMSLFDPSPIERFVREAINPSELRKGTELWVTAFPCMKFYGIKIDNFFEFIRTRTGTGVHWLCVNDLKDDEALYNLLLASAALPWVFPRRKVNNVFYIDGGLADNVPLKPLADRGCNYVIVIHLQNGVVWERKQFPNQTIIEIRPQESIDKFNIPIAGKMCTFLDFSRERIAELKRRGYKDAKDCMEPILKALGTINSHRDGIDLLHDSTTSLLNSTKQLMDDESLY